MCYGYELTARAATQPVDIEEDDAKHKKRKRPASPVPTQFVYPSTANQQISISPNTTRRLPEVSKIPIFFIK